MYLTFAWCLIVQSCVRAFVKHAHMIDVRSSSMVFELFQGLHIMSRFTRLVWHVEIVHVFDTCVVFEYYVVLQDLIMACRISDVRAHVVHAY
jgi:hypothetical protein